MDQQEEISTNLEGGHSPGMMGMTGATATLGGRYEIQFGERLSAYDSPQANAFAVHDLESRNTRHFALVLKRNGYGRFGLAGRFTGLGAAGMLNILAHGAAAAPDAERPRMAVILERPAGGRVLARGDKPAERFDERALVDRLLLPLEDTLRTIHRAGLTHRAIRPDNLFYRDLADGPLVLGDCLTAPPGFDQPDAFEPIESAMASPAGRGNGTPASDMFALGVTLVTLLGGRWPGQQHPEERIMRRIERGSFGEIAGTLRCSHDMEDLISGLLYDGAESRWNVDQLRAWLNKRSVGRRPFSRVRRDIRPLKVEGLSCSTPRAAAYALSRHPEAARTIAADGNLTRWLERSVGEIRMADQVAKIAGDGGDDDRVRSKVDDIAISRLCRIMDPEGPVYLRGAAVMLDGFGDAIAEAILSGDREAEKPLEEMLAHGLPIEALPDTWSTVRIHETKVEFRGYQGFVRGSARGIGIERCLYEMNSGIPCQSMLLGAQLVRSLEELLPALNRVSSGGEAPAERPRDAHIMAFVATHMPVPDQQRAANDVSRAALGSQDCLTDLAHFARIQKICGNGPLRNLARWIGTTLRPALEGFYSRSRRERLAAEMSSVMSSGNLSALMSLVNNREEQEIDREEYAHALAHQAHHDQMMAHFQALFNARRAVSQAYGRRGAFVIGCIILLASCVAAVGGGVM
jgi:hypothetical protein